MAWFQSTFRLPPFKRGFHLITGLLEANALEIHQINIGLAHLFIHHTSASLTLNENADPTVRADFESHFNHMVPENAPYYRHDYEGPDDMPAHLKASLLGHSLTIPITAGSPPTHFPKPLSLTLNMPWRAHDNAGFYERSVVYSAPRGRINSMMVGYPAGLMSLKHHE